jgi:tRNA A-37 threonylcarbamoyl transferase component Bud32
MAAPRLATLLQRWEEARSQGTCLSPEQVCAGWPHLAPAVARAIASQEELDRQAAAAAAATRPPANDPGPTNEAATLPQAAGPPSPGVPPAPPGYEILGELGRGGMGVVYKARQVKLDRVVALKMILAGGHASPADLARFHTEAQAIARLQHPHIVQIFEVGAHEGHPFFSLEFCPGGSLERRLRGQPLAGGTAAALVHTLAQAVHHAHLHGIVHRDIKPGNILLVGHPDAPLEECQPRVTDFGLAKKVGEGGPTLSHSVMGTPSYMAPEQAGGNHQTGPAADVYALGAVLYELLAGRPPFRGATPMDTLLQVVADEPPPLRPGRPGVSRDLETVCLKCLHKDPARRYASAEDLADELGRFLRGEPILARPMGVSASVGRWAQQRPALAATFAGLLLLYGNHLALLGLGLTEGGAFHWFITLLVAGWAAGAAAFQGLSNRPGWRWSATYAWAAFDVLMFTAFLLRANGPRSDLVVCYLLLIAGAALRFRVLLVWFVTALCAASYFTLLADARHRRPHLQPGAAAGVIFLLSMAIMALVVSLLLRRFRLALAQER